MPKILKTTEGAVRLLTISNQRKRNAMEGSMAGDFLRFLDEAEDDPQIRVVVVTGEGSVAFCSGHDLKEIASGAHAATNLGERPFLRPREMSTPVIAAVNGHCYAAALILALSCDLRVVSENATFGSPGARLGMLPEGGQLWRLPRLMSRAMALEMMLTAQPLTATNVFHAGFVNRIVPQGQVLDEAMSLAHSVARNSPSVVSAIKLGVLLGEDQRAADAEEYENRVARKLEVEQDAHEGVEAFFQKRAPVFRDV